MTARKYNDAREGLGLAEINLATDSLTLIALEGYTFDVADVFADLTGIIDTAAVTGQTLSASGVLNCGDIIFTALAGGDDTTCFVLRSVTADRLLSFHDQFFGGLPVALTGDGTPVTIGCPPNGLYRV